MSDSPDAVVGEMNEESDEQVPGRAPDGAGRTGTGGRTSWT